jgi:hypothetical protein
VVITPTGRRGEVAVRLFGDLETMLLWAQDKGGRQSKPVRGFLTAVGEGVLVAGSERSGSSLDRHKLSVAI